MKGYMEKERLDARFQKTVAMAINNLNGITIRNRHVVGLDTHDLAILLVSGVDGEKTAAAAALVHEPEVGEGGGERGGDSADGIGAEVGE